MESVFSATRLIILKQGDCEMIRHMKKSVYFTAMTIMLISLSGCRNEPEMKKDVSAEQTPAMIKAEKAVENNPNMTPQLKLDLEDQTDTYAIPFDTSNEEENLEMQGLEKIQAKEQAKKEAKQAAEAATINQ